MSEFHRENLKEFCEWNSHSAISEQNSFRGSYENTQSRCFYIQIHVNLMHAAAATFQRFIIGLMADALGTAVAGFATAMVLLGLRAPGDEKQRSKYCKQTLHIGKSNRYKEFLS